MNWWMILDTSLNALSVNKGRTFLTSLGITIGIAAVIAMVSAGNGAKSKLDDAIGNIGPNLVVARSGARTNSGLTVTSHAVGSFTREDAAAIREQLAPLINGCSEVTQFPVMASSKSNSYFTALVGGVPEVFRIRRWKMAAGMQYHAEHVKRQDKVAVLGKTVADKLFPNQNPVGKSFRAAGHQFRVIGLLEARGRNIRGDDQDDIIMIPISTLMRKVMGTDRCMLILAEARNTDLVDEVSARMERILDFRHPTQAGEEPDYTVSSVRDMTELVFIMANTFSGLTLAIATVSLVVGGIGVMNIMLVSVTERTREIGIRMAIGARTSDVLGQFLMEAVLLTLVGGGVGIALGGTVAWLIAYLAGWQFTITLESVLIAVAVSAAVGIFFGYYPARKASMLDPIEALRFE